MSSLGNENPPVTNQDSLPDGGGPAIRPPQKRLRKLWIILLLVLLAVMAFNPFSLIFFNVFLSMRQIKAVEAKLQKPTVYEPVARTLAVYCQSDPGIFPKMLSYAWLPGEAAGLGNPWCEITPGGAFVQYGGGFYHFGYHLELDAAASTPATNVWSLSLAREDSPDLPLLTLRLAAKDHLTVGDLQKLMGANFDQFIKAGRTDAYRDKVVFQLRYGQMAQAAATCQDWMQAQPDSWLPRFSYAHVRCRLGETEPAAAQFSDWVNAHKNFPHDTYLALFNYREGRTNQALAAVRLALSQPFVEPPGSDGSKFYLGQNGALIAYAAGDYDLCLALCDKMLADREADPFGSDHWWRRKILRIKAATMLMQGNLSVAVKLMNEIPKADPAFWSSQAGNAKSDSVLLTAINRQDVAFVRDFRNWADELETWFSPFESDESGFHGSDLKVPTPYPPSWKSDLMNTNPLE
jgi:tetratricopeptide (TPR) repeat protein